MRIYIYIYIYTYCNSVRSIVPQSKAFVHAKLLRLFRGVMCNGASAVL